MLSRSEDVRHYTADLRFNRDSEGHKNVLTNVRLKKSELISYGTRLVWKAKRVLHAIEQMQLRG